MKTRVFGLIIAALVFTADQFVKYIVRVPFDLQARGHVEIFPMFSLTWVANPGVSLGLFSANSEMGRWFLVAMTAAIAIGVLVWLWREVNRWDVLALGMILGGALGNIVDRARFGYVVDFLDFKALYFPWVFNVADAAITLGVILLLLRALLSAEKPKESADA